MVENKDNFNRRTVLEGVGAVSLSAFGLSGPGEATNTDSESSSGSQIQYDYRGQNSAVDKAKIITKIHKAGEENGEALKKVITPVLKGPGAKHLDNFSLEKGEYVVKSEAIINGGPSVTAKRDFKFPEGGVPDYSAIVVRVNGEESVEVNQRKI